MSKLTVKLGYTAEWLFAAEPAIDSSNQVWFCIECGPMYGGTFLSLAEAVSLGNLLIAAAQMAAGPDEEVKS